MQKNLCMPLDQILIIGASGQVGSELTENLRNRINPASVIAADINPPPQAIANTGPFEYLDVLDKEHLESIVGKYSITHVYNLAAILSATAEQHPMFAWKLNMEGLFNVLNLAKDGHINKLFWPSSIAVFGPNTPQNNTPQTTVMDPNTVYGISKLAGERWCAYYYENYNVDVRSIRYPGLISYKTEPGGGTTDYAVAIFHQALANNFYESFLNHDTYLPMLYMPDAIKGTIQIMEAPQEAIKIRSSYNVAGFSFAPQDLAYEIQRHLSDFTINYNPDFRQQIADGWPSSINDSKAQEDWNWNPSFSFSDMVEDMIKNIQVTSNSL